MAKEYEIISGSQFQHLNIFMVRMLSRTTHIHREIELGLILDGTVTLKNSADSFTLQKGDLYLINSMDAHEFSSSGEGALILSIQFSMRLMDSFFPGQSNLRFSGSARLADQFTGRLEAYEVLRILCVELAHSYLGMQPDYEYRCFSLAALLLYHVKRDVPNQVLPNESNVLMQQKGAKILSVTDYIDENYTHKLLLEDIAQKEGLSMTYLSHLFKEILGVSFQEYLKQKRFEHACQLIVTTQRSILDISISSGFSDVRYLTKLFQQRYGCTPNVFRKHATTPQRQHISASESTEYWFAQQDSYLLLTPLLEQIRKQCSFLPMDSLW